MSQDKAMRVYVSTKTHDKIMEEKRKQGGRNIPYVIGELIDLGLAYKKILAKAQTNS